MEQASDVVSMRALRLNNIILGDSNNATGISSEFASTMTKDCLFDAFYILLHYCHNENKRNHSKNLTDFVNKFANLIVEAKSLRVNVNDFKICDRIGRGSYGSVYVVVERITGDIYAMKKINKKLVSSVQATDERMIMTNRSCPWITNLQYAFQDVNHLYLIMEYLPGGDLLNLMTRHGSLSENWTRFYLAEIALAINALHQLGYVHRDIKPENILIDRLGHLKLADFGNAISIKKRDYLITSVSPVGTPDYIAPEILQSVNSPTSMRKILDGCCDYWSMGIIGYELICEITPFHDNTIYDTYANILSHCDSSETKKFIQFPSDANLSDEYMNLIELLVTTPEKRLNFNNIKKHAFFQRIDWDNIRMTAPPFIPEIENEMDTRNFEEVCRNGSFQMACNEVNQNLSATSNLSDKDLNFIGYGFTYLEPALKEANTAYNESITRLTNENNDLLQQIRDRTQEIIKLKENVFSLELTVKQTSIQIKALLESKDEILKLKNVLAKKNLELTTCRTQIKTLEASLRIEKDMWSRKEITIADMLFANRQKYEEAKSIDQARYESDITEKKTEIANVIKKLEERNAEFAEKVEECCRLQEKIDNFSMMLGHCKLEKKKNYEYFTEHIAEVKEFYEQQMSDLHSKLNSKLEANANLKLKIRDLRTVLNEYMTSKWHTEESKKVALRNNEEILAILNTEVEINQRLIEEKNDLKTKLSENEKNIETMQQDMMRLERKMSFESSKNRESLQEDILQFEKDIQVVKVDDFSNNNTDNDLQTQRSPYQTASGSLIDVRSIEEQFMADLEASIREEYSQNAYSDRLNNVIERMEEMMKRFGEQFKGIRKYAAQITNDNDKLVIEAHAEKKLASLRAQIVEEKTAAKDANRFLWRVQKQLDDINIEKKQLQRRLDLYESRVQRITKERDEAKSLCKINEELKEQCESKIEEMKADIVQLKKNVQNEHNMWTKAEQERVMVKSEVTEYISKITKLERSLLDSLKNIEKYKEKCNILDAENRELIKEINEEKNKVAICSENLKQQQNEYNILNDNFNRLKYVSSITDNQLTVVEQYLANEQQENKTKECKITTLISEKHQKDEKINQLQSELLQLNELKEYSEIKMSNLRKELGMAIENVKKLEEKLNEQQQNYLERVSKLHSTQEQLEGLQIVNRNNLQKNENYEKELLMLKEENTRVLTQLFHANESLKEVQKKLESKRIDVAGLEKKILEMTIMAEEKENYMKQRDIKSKVLLDQHKKLVNFLQDKLELLEHKKKKTLAGKIFPIIHQDETHLLNSKINALQDKISATNVDNIKLDNELNKLESPETTKVMSKLLLINNNYNINNMSIKPALKDSKNSPKKSKDLIQSKAIESEKENLALQPLKNSIDITNMESLQRYHHLSLSIKETTKNCSVCSVSMIENKAYWQCKQCNQCFHRKCRSEVINNCGVTQKAPESVQHIFPDNRDDMEPVNGIDICGNNMFVENINFKADNMSMDQYSYEPKLDDIDENIYNDDNECVFIFRTPVSEGKTARKIEIYCASEIDEGILLLGCNTGLYAYHIGKNALVYIAGLEEVTYIAISVSLSKVLLIASYGNCLYQCDLRHLKSRCQANECLRPALEASLLDLPLIRNNEELTETWRFITVSDMSEQPLDTVAIVATILRIIILKYDIKYKKFKPIRSLDTAIPVNAVMFTRLSAIVASDKFFEIDLDTFATEEFVDISDESLALTAAFKPITAINIGPNEILLCYAERGIFLDQYGCRSRAYGDINWDRTPINIKYIAPFLYVAYSDSVQVIRIYSSYSKRLANDVIDNNKAICNQEKNDITPFERVEREFFAPVLICKAQEMNMYLMVCNQLTGLQEIYLLSGLKMYKEKFNESIETIHSIFTITTADLAATDTSIL